MKRYWVLITDDIWGVFGIDAEDYPDIFFENMAKVSTVYEINLNKFLIKNLGRNTLIKNRFEMPYAQGKVFRR